jgi:DNA-binding NtrC family response regulator
MPIAHKHTELLDLLIVDDEADARDMLGEFCVRQGFRVALAPDGRAALTAIERATPPYPIVIADLHMPHADGFAVLEAARRANASCYVIMVTGYATIDAAVRAVKAGAYDFLAKPFALGQLEVLLARIRDRMVLERENRALTRQAGSTAVPRNEAALEMRVRLLEERLALVERELAAARPPFRTPVSETR